MSPRGPATKAQLSTVQLGTGLAAAGGIVVLVSFLRVAEYWAGYRVSNLSFLAWILLGLTLVALIFWVRYTSARLTRPAFFIFAAILILCSVLDLAGVWELTATRVYPTAAVAAGGVFLALTTLRPTREMVWVSAILSIGFIAVFIAQGTQAPSTSAPELLMAVFALVPLGIGIVVVGTYRNMLTQALDRVLLLSTVEDPAYGVSLRAKQELSALDLEVEELFDAVAAGSEPLPLSPERARRAGELATELRAHLIAGRVNTWLAHAINESDVLRGRITVEDPEGLAGLMDPGQRDGLLSAIWLLSVTDGDTTPQGTLEFSREGIGPRSDSLRITLTFTGMTRLNIEPATWPGLDRVGRYGVTSTATGVKIMLRSALR